MKVAKLGIWCPTYKRPHKLQEVASNIEQTTKNAFNLYFGCEPDDLETIEAAKATGHKVIINKGKMGYSDTVQTIYEETKEPIFFHANDDFLFLEGWDAEPVKYLEEHPDIMTLGAHDGTAPPSFSTISFIKREYIEKMSGVVDIPNRVFYPYNHNFQDTEFTRTAVKRDVWAKADYPCIQHARGENDPTYEKNVATYGMDSETFEKRRHLFE